MDEDVTMEDESKPKTEEDDLKQYNLDNYDEDESMPGALHLETSTSRFQ